MIFSGYSFPSITLEGLIMYFIEIIIMKIAKSLCHSEIVSHYHVDVIQDITNFTTKENII